MVLRFCTSPVPEEYIVGRVVVVFVVIPADLAPFLKPGRMAGSSHCTTQSVNSTTKKEGLLDQSKLKEWKRCPNEFAILYVLESSSSFGFAEAFKERKVFKADDFRLGNQPMSKRKSKVKQITNARRNPGDYSKAIICSVQNTYST